jgi:hypothetical protein
MLPDKCIISAFHSAVNEMIWTHIIYTDGSLIRSSEGWHYYINYHFSVTDMWRKSESISSADTVFIRSVWYNNMKYRPTEGVGRGQHSFSVLSLAWSRYKAKAILLRNSSCRVQVPGHFMTCLRYLC